MAADTSGQRTHHHFTKRGPLDEALEPASHVHELLALDRQLHPAQRAGAERDVGWREIVARDVRPRLQMRIHDLEQARRLRLCIFEGLRVAPARLRANESDEE